MIDDLRLHSPFHAFHRLVQLITSSPIGGYFPEGNATTGRACASEGCRGDADSGPFPRAGRAGPRFDLARALAIFGMVVVHFSLVMAAGRTGPGWLRAGLGFLDGRAAATFVILAGIGVTLMSQRAVKGADSLAITKVREALIRRGLFLLALGFINLRIWPGDILRVYGVSLLLAARLITASDRRLLLGALGYALGFVALFLVLDFEKNWDWSTMTYHRLWTPTGVVRNLFYDGFRSVLPWTGFLVFGMWLGRLDLRDSATNGWVAFAAACTALGAEFISWLCASYFLAHPRGMDQETIKALFGTESMPALPLSSRRVA